MEPRTTDHVDAQWNQFRRSRDDRSRNALIEHYMPLVKKHALAIVRRLPRHVNSNDLIAAGSIGLIHAIKAFDSQRGVRFENYCVPRIRGSIIDEMRKSSWVPRSARNRAARAEKARHSLAQSLDREPDQKELAHELGIRGPNGRRGIRTRVVKMLPFSSRPVDDQDLVREFGAEIADARAVNPRDQCAANEMLEAIGKVLTTDELRTVNAYYFKSQPLKAIGRSMKLSESRISQLLSQIRKKIRAQFPDLCTG